MPFFVFCYRFCFSLFCLIGVLLILFSCHFHLQEISFSIFSLSVSGCVFLWSESLVSSLYIGLVFNPISHPMSFDLNLVHWSLKWLFYYRYAFIAILLLVFWLFLKFFTVTFFFLFLYLSFDDFLIVCFSFFLSCLCVSVVSYVWSYHGIYICWPITVSTCKLVVI